MEIKDVTISYPLDNSEVYVDLQNDWTAEYVVSELIKAGFMPELNKGHDYEREYYVIMCRETHKEIRGITPISELGIKDNGTLQIGIRPYIG